ncbi:hypothetical protein FACS1894216_17700 [Synergistales bacterium]|nr:hypothetical protein FACS1894216_17700 [Synergistales bacterium]
MRIQSISVKGFKACQDITLESGCVNVLIGSNGAGKSTILEAIGLLSAAMTDRVDNVALTRKGIRLSTDDLYQSSFKSVRRSPTIELEIVWQDEKGSNISDNFIYRVCLNAPNAENAWRYHSEVLYKNDKKIIGRSGASSKEFKNYVGMLMRDDDEAVQYIHPSMDKLKNYGIYQPNTPTLRGTMQDPYQAEPVGLCGGRLAEAVDEILSIGRGEKFGSMWMDEILDLIDWADKINITPPKKSNINASVPTTRRVIEFADRYMRSDKRFTAYDASEGALYVLLLLCLAVHDKTPDVFAIDNFDHAMNPRLAKVTTKKFCELILDTGKTVFLTTHNPLVLDGLSLQNNDIRLFTVSRSKDGYAKIRRITVDQKLIDAGQPLSRLWVNGRLGGVPDLL